MFGLNVFVVAVCFISFSGCDFGEIVDIDGIINNATQLPHMDDQIVSGMKKLMQTNQQNHFNDA